MSPQPANHDAYSITFRAADDGPPDVFVRLRRLLKVSLRRFGLRAEDIRKTRPDRRADQSGH